MTTDKKYFKSFFKEYYFLIVPVIITFLLYSISLSYGFRNFDEDLMIKDFCVKKSFSEYLEKYLLIDWSGITQAQGFAFTSIQNVHFNILQRPFFYLLNFIFQAKPFFYHLLSLLIHLLAIYSFAQFVCQLTKNKIIALISAITWAVHPTNVESVIWATNWSHPLSAAFYFLTLNKIASLTSNGMPSQVSMVFISFIVLIQILFSEHNITLPFAIFLTILYKTNYLSNQAGNFTRIFKLCLPLFFTLFIYLILRIVMTSTAPALSVNINLKEIFERISFISPQVFLHHLKLILFPAELTIDQLDLLFLDKGYGGGYHLLSLITVILFMLLIWVLRAKFTYLSYGLLLYIISLLPFLQIVPFYSIGAERYNYLASSFIIFGAITALYQFFSRSNKLFIIFSIIVFLLLGIRTEFRIFDWKNSKTLFLSTINTSKSLLKKGIWTYNLAISQKNETKKVELLNLSNNLLNLFLNTPQETGNLNVLKTYGLDEQSLFAKAALRISTNHEILGNKELQYNYLLKALEYSNNNLEIQSTIYKNLGTYYFQQNDINKAIEYYKKNYSISPSPTIDFALAVCYLKLNDLSNYENYLKKAVSVISAYNISPFKTYGNFLEVVKNDYNNAIKYYKIATLLENNPEPYILLGSLYARLEQKDNALKYINRGLYSFPENPILISLKAKVKP